MGFSPIFSMGFDYVLFILSQFFLRSNGKKLLIQFSTFAVAHSLSLGLAAAGLIMNTQLEKIVAIFKTKSC